MKKTENDYSTLRGKIREKFGSESNFAEKWGKNFVTVSRKLNNKTNFNQDEIFEVCDLLEEDYSNIEVLFYTIKVRKYELRKGGSYDNSLYKKRLIRSNPLLGSR